MFTNILDDFVENFPTLRQVFVGEAPGLDLARQEIEREQTKVSRANKGVTDRNRLSQSRKRKKEVKLSGGPEIQRLDFFDDFPEKKGLAKLGETGRCCGHFYCS